MSSKFPYAIMLENIRSAHNVGAIFRTCDCAAASKLYLAGYTPYPPHNRIPKTALGAIDYVEWEHDHDELSMARRLKELGHVLVAVEQTPRAMQFDQYEYPDNCILIFGNEVDGVSPDMLALCDVHVELPMFGEKKSLNVATTAGIVAYHVALQMRRGNNGKL